jgi:hypothetical protein
VHQACLGRIESRFQNENIAALDAIAGGVRGAAGRKR